MEVRSAICLTIQLFACWLFVLSRALGFRVYRSEAETLEQKPEIAVDLVADTNVWYDIGAGIRSPAALKSGGNRLIATPISFLETVSSIDERTFADRTQAAKAVLAHADEIAEDSESHLRKIWGLSPVGSFPWIEGFKALAQTASIPQLGTGVDDLQERVRRTVNVPLAAGWRAYHWNDFRDQVIQALDQHIPGYASARAKGRSRQLNKENAKIFAEAMRSSEVRQFIVESTFVRALLAGGEVSRAATKEEQNTAEPLVSPYVDAYTEYIISCASEFAPQPNDLGDSECFLYLQDNRHLLSSDVRWVKIARRVCPSRVHDPENKVPA